MSSKIGIYMRSLMASWAGYGLNIIVMFFLSPFVVHSLGNARYGVWSLLMTVTGYLGLVELGVRASTGRYINYYLGKDQPGKVNDVVNTSLAFYCLASVMVAVVALSVGQLFPTIFPKVDPQMAQGALGILILMTVNVWLGLWGATFGQLLFANDRFDLLNLASIVALAIRAGGTVLALKLGMGLMALAVVLVISNAAAFVVLVLSSRYWGVPVKFGWRFASIRCFREIFSFGAWSFVGNVSSRIIDYTNAALIGILLGPAEITFYAIGYMLIDNARELLAYVVRVLTPDIQKAAGNSRNLVGQLMIKGTNATMFVGVPLLCCLLVVGPEFIRHWMGPGFEKSGVVLLIVTISQFANVANMACGTSLNALGYVKLMAFISGIEAVINICLSVVLVKYFGMGIYGVAIGTAAPCLIMTGVVLLLQACRRTGLGTWSYLHATTLRWVLASALLLPLGWLVCHYVHESGWGMFWTRVALMLLVYLPFGALLVLGPAQTRSVLSRLNVFSTSRRARALEETRL